MKVERNVYFIKMQLTWKTDTTFNGHPVVEMLITFLYPFLTFYETDIICWSTLAVLLRVISFDYLRRSPSNGALGRDPFNQNSNRSGKSGPPQKVDRFFETFPVAQNRSIEFWTEISGNFGWMDRAPRVGLRTVFLLQYG